MLVTVIAHTEDAKRYTSPVTWWNDQLQSILGLGWNKLDRARKRAVKAGWLHYEPGRKGKVGKYWATIPPEYADIPDGPYDSGPTIILCTSAERSAERSAEDSQLSSALVQREAGEKRGTSAEHSNLTLNPKPRRSIATVRPEEIPIPTILDTPRFQQAWKRWLAFRREEGLTIKPQATKTQLTKLSKWGASRAIIAIDDAIAHGWKGVFEPKTPDPEDDTPTNYIN